MTDASPFPLVAVDVGNSRVKFGLFPSPPTNDSLNLPAPAATLDLRVGAEPWSKLDEFLGARSAASVAWHIGSVQRQTASQLVDQLKERGATRITLLTSHDLPLAIRLPQPDRVGIDRLLGAVAADHLRAPHKPAVVVHVGTAITVNLVDSTGAFRGGAILPGIAMSARALHEFTDLLPLIDMQSLADAPPAIGESTVPAMTSGLYWGAVGGVKQLIELFGREAGGEPDVFLTGGAAPSVAKNFPGTVRCEPHLILGAIALVASRQR